MRIKHKFQEYVIVSFLGQHLFVYETLPILAKKSMHNINANILVVDDDLHILRSADLFLKQLNANITGVSQPEDILKILPDTPIDIILLDMNFSPGENDGQEGLYYLQKILAFDPEAVVIMMTAYGNIQIAVDALKKGATDFVVKPWENEKLLATINAAINLKRNKDEVSRLQEMQSQLNEDLHRSAKIIGESISIRKIFNIIDKVSPTDADVLILGENGTGKELVAREVHQKSSRNKKSFIKVDLGSIAESLFESELFGHVKGAFTDAKNDRIGRFEMAKGGTIFLDEIANLPMNLQSKLLTVLQKRKVSRVGSNKEINLDIRLICATNQNLPQMIEQGLFREDLYYRINTVEIELPPLRERINDIDLLFDYFLDIFKKKYHRPKLKASKSVIHSMKQYKWPGNIRELEHSIERAVIMSENNVLTFPDFQLKEREQTSGEEKKSFGLVENEKKLILEAIKATGGHMSKAAKELGITRSGLYRRLEKHGL